MKRMIVRAAVLAMFTAGMATTVGIAGAGTAMACGQENQRSDQFAASLPQVNPGDTGQHVLALQLSLRHEGYTQLNGTGTYAQNTLSAVQDFQRKNGINASGIVGSKTWHALVGKMPPSLTGQGWATPPSFGINPGERNGNKLSALFDAMQRIHPYTSQGLPDEGDVYGPQMQRLVQDFQRRAGIKDSGIVGPKTWAALYEVVAASGQWGC
ncbi:peptidoglycan hydrolase-like protein with peptidoglycan-binding domain [Kibdelosporangium banguiense]|uniref:Peptidoglycan hydrolase-like protein with peptidoglycan-binding domain n=1 Tax=Kibdelosporangium banguiense TaxID=1365924 RepID=A0ABS4TCK5_9PSEU|nr:peptidoglycan-binding protein [Kibdelosporangium banguiense]MBP2322155.1 peptidoglycan hydrolase-like protein with peptidoglycan-binding domain [Kibdelosporangium banguiense]